MQPYIYIAKWENGPHYFHTLINILTKLTLPLNEIGHKLSFNAFTLLLLVIKSVTICHLLCLALVNQHEQDK